MKPVVLFLEWHSFGNEFMIKALEDFGYEVARMTFLQESEDARHGVEITEKILGQILEKKPAFVFSFNYFPVAAIACKAARVKYVSWVYDSPAILMYSQTIFYDTNRVFVFDSMEVQRLRQFGVNHVYYMPMAAAVEYYDQFVPGEKHHEKYGSDVSFLGSMYSETHQHMFRHLEKLDEYTKGFLYGIMDVQKAIYGMDILEKALQDNPKIVETMLSVCPISAQGDGLETVEWTYANYFLARKVTALERADIMKCLSDTIVSQRNQSKEQQIQPWTVRLFTPEKVEGFPGILANGKLDYYHEAPYAMKCAKINLNISLRSIHNGIPLRCMDILGCGGFLLTNYQPDFMEHFIPGEDFVYYENVAEIPTLIAYYLEHEEERKRIARNGYEKVKAEFRFGRQVEKILDLI